MNRRNYYGKAFKITSQNSGKTFDVRGAMMGNGSGVGDMAEIVGNIIQYRYHGGDNQKFLLFPMDDNTFVIAAKHSGRVLDVAGANRNDKANVIQYHYNAGDNQRFLLQDIGSDVVIIKAKHSGKVLDVYGASKEDRANIIQYRYHGRTNQRFKVELVDELPVSGLAETHRLGDAPRFSRFGEILPATTTPVIVGQTLLPYFVVEDSLSRDIAINSSPYYKLTHEQYWKQLYQIELSGQLGREKQETYKYGMTRIKRRSMERTVKMEMKADFAFKFLPFLKSLSSSVTSELKVTESFEEKSVEEREKTETITYAGEDRVALAKYAVVSRFSLTRDDGIKVGEDWEVLNAQVFIEESFPDRNSMDLIRTEVLSDNSTD